VLERAKRLAAIPTDLIVRIITFSFASEVWMNPIASLLGRVEKYQIGISVEIMCVSNKISDVRNTG
jgi:hypothetical protein